MCGFRNPLARKKGRPVLLSTLAAMRSFAMASSAIT
jgi:hypothetical protein